ncbi:hypothetical protein ACWEGE_19515 [Amycolatopsis sp. NPDC004747]
MSDVSWLRLLTGGQLPAAVVIAVVIVLALDYLIKAATPLVTIILHKLKPDHDRRVQVERGRLKIVIEPQEEPKRADKLQAPDRQLPPAADDGTPRPKMPS